jgi:predicted negative regulator of RcsB-dependent stress response
LVIAISESDHSSDKKDRWDKADIVLKGLIAVLLPGAIAFYGYWTERQTAQRAQKTQTYEAAVQTLSNREAVAADLKAKMLETLMQHYFAGSAARKVAVLELMAMNFDEQFQLRPLFDALDLELKDPHDKADLRRVARNLADREVSAILASGGQVCDVVLAMNKAVMSPCAPVSITLQQIHDDRIVVGTSSPGAPVYEISFFDTPLTDRSTIGDLTYSLLLKTAKEADQSANVKMAVFPRYSYSLQSRLQLDQLMGKYLAPTVEFTPP